MNKTINLISINKKMPKYLAKYNVKSIDCLTLDQGNKFFIKIIKDFKGGILTLDELSVFSNKIFHHIGKKYPKSDLFFVSLSACELNFSVRTQATFKNIINILNDIETFFTKNK